MSGEGEAGTGLQGGEGAAARDGGPGGPGRTGGQDTAARMQQPPASHAPRHTNVCDSDADVSTNFNSQLYSGFSTTRQTVSSRRRHSPVTMKKTTTTTAQFPSASSWSCSASGSTRRSPAKTCLRLAAVALLSCLLLAPESRASDSHQAKVQTAECSYTLVVNEFDVSKCPTMQADAQPEAHQWSSNLNNNNFDDDSDNNPSLQSASGSSSRTSRKGLPPSHSAPRGRGRGERPRHKLQPFASNRADDALGGRQQMDVLRGQVTQLEGRLLEEMVRNRELNSTLFRHSTALSQAQKQLQAYDGNFTALYRAMMFVQRQLHRQRKINRSMNKKLSNVLLDVMEVNNVLTRAPVSPGDGGKAAALKDFEVQSVARVRSCPGITAKSTTYRDCAAVFDGGHKQSGVYYVKPTAAACPVPVWCDMDTPPGGWLVVQRRHDGSVSFNRHWAAYRDGFGSVAGEHWLGNDNMFLLTNQDHYQLRIDLWDFEGNRVHASYSTFRVAGERDKYQLTVTGYTGSAQDSLYRHNAMAFSTPDRDNDGRREAHCAAEWEAGWWFNNCWFALLNGAYHNRSDVSYRGIAWNHWKREQLRKTEMKIRPKTEDSGAGSDSD